MCTPPPGRGLSRSELAEGTLHDVVTWLTLMVSEEQCLLCVDLSQRTLTDSERRCPRLGAIPSLFVLSSSRLFKGKLAWITQATLEVSTCGNHERSSILLHSTAMYSSLLHSEHTSQRLQLNGITQHCLNVFVTIEWQTLNNEFRLWVTELLLNEPNGFLLKTV